MDFRELGLKVLYFGVGLYIFSQPMMIDVMEIVINQKLKRSFSLPLMEHCYFEIVICYFYSFIFSIEYILLYYF
jgi:hypothetical protein